MINYNANSDNVTSNDVSALLQQHQLFLFFTIMLISFLIFSIFLFCLCNYLYLSSAYLNIVLLFLIVIVGMTSSVYHNAIVTSTKKLLHFTKYVISHVIFVAILKGSYQQKEEISIYRYILFKHHSDDFQIFIFPPLSSCRLFG